MSKAFGDYFGRESFSRAIGLLVPVTLPLMFVGMIGPGRVFHLTGSYTGAVMGAVIAFAVAALLAVLLALGSTYRRLELEGEDDLIGAGIHFCAYAGFDESIGQYWLYLEVNEGSYGGRYGKDAMDSVDNLMANTRNNPIEDMETHLPLRVLRCPPRGLSRSR